MFPHHDWNSYFFGNRRGNHALSEIVQKLTFQLKPCVITVRDNLSRYKYSKIPLKSYKFLRIKIYSRENHCSYEASVCTSTMTKRSDPDLINDRQTIIVHQNARESPTIKLQKISLGCLYLSVVVDWLKQIDDCIKLETIFTAGLLWWNVQKNQAEQTARVCRHGRPGVRVRASAAARTGFVHESSRQRLLVRHAAWLLLRLHCLHSQ